MRILFLTFIFFTFLTGCKKKTEQAEIPIPVTIYKIEPKTIPAILEFVGVAHSSHLVEIRSRVEGYLWKIDYQEGSFVKQGDLLFEIDPRQFIASVDEAKGNLAKQKAILWAAEQSVKRYKPLYEQKAASQRDLDDAISNQLAGEASVEEATAKLQEAQLNLSYTAITSPISGLSGKSNYREGTLITPAINGLLTSVSIIDPIWVNFSVADSYLLSTRVELESHRLKLPENEDFDVSLTLSDGSKFPTLGKVNFASPTLDENTGTMNVRAVFANPDALIRPGQFVKTQILGATWPNAMIVPKTAVQQGAKGMYVYVVNDQNRAEIRYVVPGEWYENYWIIKAGLHAGEIVIAEGVNRVSNGSLITVIPSQNKREEISTELIKDEDDKTFSFKDL